MDRSQWVVSVDDHLIEPPDLWTSRLPAKYQGVCPQVRTYDDGEFWVYDGKRVQLGGNLVQAGYGVENFNPRPMRYDEIRPACYDAAERIKVMDEDGVLASMPFPTFPRFCGQEFTEARDRELGMLCVQAYNDFLLDEWAAAAPGRVIPCVIIPLWDPVAAAKEIDRCASKGAKSVAFSEHPPALGLPSIHDPAGYWDPVFEVASNAGMPISIHVGSSSTVPNTGPDAPKIIPSVLIHWVAARTCVDWLFSDAIVRHPNLRLCLSEGGIGWLPLVLSTCVRQIDHYRYMDKFEVKGSIIAGGLQVTRRDEEVRSWKHGDKTPLDVFREHIRGCFIGGAHALARETIDALGADLFMAEVDFPHADSSYPHTMRAVDQTLDGLPQDDQYRLRQGNAIEWFSLSLDERARS